MDGENTTMYSDLIHARSIDSLNHPSRNWVKQFWGQIRYDIPVGWRICGENLFAKHSIFYSDLPSYFLGFSVWDSYNECLSWDETQTWFNLLGINSIPVMYDGIFDEEKIRELFYTTNWKQQEGYVIRIADQFRYRDFRTCVGKYVRKNHVQTVKHWMHGQPMIRNELI
jgi:hypothetical protein